MGKIWKWCLLNDLSGKLETGWQQVKGSWYYLYSNGVMASNEWIQYKGQWYYLKKDGDMATNCVIGNWAINKDGVATKQINTNSDLFEFIKRFEGCQLKAYICPAGVKTIGIGCTNPYWVSHGQITMDEAKQAFNQDIKKFETAVDKLINGLNLNKYQRDALISFAFNCGEAALSGSTLLKDIKAGNNNKIEQDFLMWTKGGGKTLPGLVTRRKAEAKLYLEGKYI